LFKKVVIADTCAEYANMIFNDSGSYGGTSLLLGALFFTFQIYGDFSGYSDIAIGTSRLFGFKLMQNFAYPYFSRDIAEFWRRWHISLSTWFRDYLYIPLGGSRGGKWMKVRNTFIIFIVSGFWHGANWTFIAWGALNAAYFLPILLANKNRVNLDGVAEGRYLPKAKEAFSILFTFTLTVIAWIFFRAENITHAGEYIADLFSGLGHYMNYYRTYRILVNVGIPFLLLGLFFLVVEWLGRHRQFAIATLDKSGSRVFNWVFYLSVAVCIFLHSGTKQEFIYFQF
jgi:D-alanyl-lipoteichoic acid acyltransferase DltB (MBOAT superfamily)